MIYNIKIKKNKKKFRKNKPRFKKTLFHSNNFLFKKKPSFNNKYRTKKVVYKHLKFIYFLKFIIIIILLLLLLLIRIQLKYFSCINDIEIENYGLTFKRKMKEYNKEKNKFAIFSRTRCPSCGLFSFYIIHLGCINYYLSKGYIPIVDLQSFKNS